MRQLLAAISIIVFANITLADQFVEKIKAAQWLATELNKQPLAPQFLEAVQKSLTQADKVKLQKIISNWNPQKQQLKFESNFSQFVVMRSGIPLMFLDVLQEQPLIVQVNGKDQFEIDPSNISKSVNHFFDTQQKKSKNSAQLLSLIFSQAFAQSNDSQNSQVQPTARSAYTDWLKMPEIVVLFASGQISRNQINPTTTSTKYDHHVRSPFSILDNVELYKTSQVICENDKMSGELTLNNKIYSFALDGNKLWLADSKKRKVMLELSEYSWSPEYIKSKKTEWNKATKLSLLLQADPKGYWEYNKLANKLHWDEPIPEGYKYSGFVKGLHEKLKVLRVARDKEVAKLAEQHKQGKISDKDYQSQVDDHGHKFFEATLMKTSELLNKIVDDLQVPAHVLTVESKACTPEPCRDDEGVQSSIWGKLEPSYLTPKGGHTSEMTSVVNYIEKTKMNFKSRFALTEPLELIFTPPNKYDLAPTPVGKQISSDALAKYKAEMTGYYQELHALYKKAGVHFVKSDYDMAALDINEQKLKMTGDSMRLIHKLKALNSCCLNNNCRADVFTSKKVNLQPGEVNKTSK